MRLRPASSIRTWRAGTRSRTATRCARWRTKYTTVSDGTCTPEYTVYSLGTRAEAATATLYYKIGADCMPFTGGPGGRYVWPLGAEVPATSFVDVKLVEH